MTVSRIRLIAWCWRIGILVAIVGSGTLYVQLKKEHELDRGRAAKAWRDVETPGWPVEAPAPAPAPAPNPVPPPAAPNPDNGFGSRMECIQSSVLARGRILDVYRDTVTDRYVMVVYQGDSATSVVLPEKSATVAK